MSTLSISQCQQQHSNLNLNLNRIRTFEHFNVNNKNDQIETEILNVKNYLISITTTEPNFVGSFDVGDYVYFFFRESAVEYINCGKSIYSRVARVCKVSFNNNNIGEDEDTVSRL